MLPDGDREQEPVPEHGQDPALDPSPIPPMKIHQHLQRNPITSPQPCRQHTRRNWKACWPSLHPAELCNQHGELQRRFYRVFRNKPGETCQFLWAQDTSLRAHGPVGVSSWRRSPFMGGVQGVSESFWLSRSQACHCLDRKHQKTTTRAPPPPTATSRRDGEPAGLTVPHSPYRPVKTCTCS